MVVIRARDEIKIDSHYMKNKLLSFFRYTHQFMFCCTEGLNYADFVAVRRDELVEVECKISLQDMINEFQPTHATKKYAREAVKHKKHFHRYCNAQTVLDKQVNRKNFYMDIPNRYYLCVPECLVEKANELIDMHNINYGIIQTDKYADSPLVIVRKANKLHTHKPNEKTIEIVGKRTTSELATIRGKVYKATIISKQLMQRPDSVNKLIEGMFDD